MVDGHIGKLSKQENDAMQTVFNVGTTRYTVESEARKQSIIDYCSKITKRTGRSTHKRYSGQFSDLPIYPAFHDGISVREYVRVYERLNAPRFHGRYSTEYGTIYTDLSDNPQYSFDDVVTVEHCEGVTE